MAKKGEKRGVKDKRLYTLEVLLIGGRVTQEFADKNPEVSRTIQIRGDQTLEELHYAIFDALNREEEHMYEFQFGKKPQDRKGKSYVLPISLVESFGYGDKPDGDLTITTIGSLDLRVRRVFYYWFDFGDDWWHKIKVKAIEEKAPKGKYPKIVKRVGQSPSQYPDWDEEWEE